MGRRPRMYRPDVVVEVTSCTTGNHFFLRPCEASTDAYLGVVGRALFLYPSVRLHALNPLSTHSTELLSAADPAQISAYIGFVKCNLSRELTRLHGLDPAIKVWEQRRARVIPIAPDPASLEARFRYCLAQGTKEDLIERPQDYPGVTGAIAITEGFALHGRWYDRTAESKARARGERFEKHTYATQYPVEFSPLPHWAAMEESTWRGRAREITDEITKTEKARRGNKPVLGPEGIMAFLPTHRGEGPTKTPAPSCHAVGKAVYEMFRKILLRFWDAYVAASHSAREGGEVSYPAYAFPAGLPMTDGVGLESIRLFSPF